MLETRQGPKQRGSGCYSGPFATTAQVDFIVQLLVRWSLRTAHARPPTQANSPRPPPTHARTTHRSRVAQWARITVDGNVIIDLASAGVILFEEDQ